MYNKFINFLKSHNLYDEKVLDYWKKNTTGFDYLDEEGRDFIGCYYQFKNGCLHNIKAIVPYMNNDKTVMMNIHEYVHFFMMYKKLGMPCKIGKDCEVLPVFFEKLYVIENPTKENVDYYNYLRECIINDNNEKYVLALKIIDDLVEFYNEQDINKINSKIKRLVLKHDIKKTFNI